MCVLFCSWSADGLQTSVRVLVVAVAEPDTGTGAKVTRGHSLFLDESPVEVRYVIKTCVERDVRDRKLLLHEEIASFSNADSIQIPDKSAPNIFLEKAAKC